MVGMIVQQLLMAAGVTDERVLSTVDRVMAGGFKATRVESFDGESMLIPKGAESILIQCENKDEELSLLVTSRKKSAKTLDSGKSL